MRIFETSYNRHIEFLDGYRQAHVNPPEASASKPQGRASGKPSLARRLAERLRPSPRISERIQATYFANLLKFHYTTRFLRSHGLGLETFGRALDVGGDRGFMSLLFSASGLAASTSIVDIVNTRTSVSQVELDALHRSLADLNRDPGHPLLARPQRNFGYHLTRDDSFWDIKIDPARARIDDYVVSNYSAYRADKKYDLITIYHAIDYFDLDAVMAHSLDMLNDGGVLLFVANYWWWPVNSTYIVGEFPYACQRLGRDDFVRYAKTHHGDEADDMIRRFDYFNFGRIRPTQSDYVAAAEKAGFTCMGTMRMMPNFPSHTKTPLPPIVLQETEGFSFDDVLEDIACLRAGVGIEDLRTAYVVCAAQRRRRTAKRSALVP